MGGDAKEESLELRHGGFQGDGRFQRRHDPLWTGILQSIVQPLEVALGTVDFKESSRELRKIGLCVCVWRGGREGGREGGVNDGNTLQLFVTGYILLVR